MEKNKENFKKLTIFCVVVISIIIVSIITIQYFDKNIDTSSQISDNIIFTYASPESQGIPNESVEKLIDTIQDFFDNEKIVGAELVVIKNRTIILHETVGWNDRENNISMEKNTLFNIRSMTKPITGAAIQLLIDEGRLSLDTKVSEYLSGFNNNVSQNITIEQLLTHRSGLPLSIITSADQYETLYSLANEIGIVGPEFEPGNKFWYSDSGTEVLGAIIEVVTNSSLDTFVTENILNPLGMNNSYYYIPTTQNETPYNRISPFYIGGSGEWIKGWSNEEPLYPFAFGSQSIYCSPLDYAYFLTMWMDEGMVGGEHLLSKDAVKRTLTPVSYTGSLGSDTPHPTGFLNLSVYYGQMAIIYSNDPLENISTIEIIGHSGSDGTYAWAWPDHDLIILYFTQSRLSTSGLKLESIIEEQLIHPDLKEINNLARNKYSRYLGSYTANFDQFRNAEFIVTVQHGNLAIDIPNQLVFELIEPDESGKWYTLKDYGFAISFVIDENGNTTGLNLHQGDNIYELPKGKPSVDYVDVYPEDMEKYVGSYQTEDPNIVVDVIINEGRLSLTGQSSLLDLYPPDDEGVWLMRFNPSIGIIFNESDDGKITSFTLILPDGTKLVRPRLEDQ